MADRQDLAARLARWNLTRDDSGPRRVYRDKQGRTYDSVTRVLSETRSRPLPEPGSYGHGLMERAAQRGTRAHEAVEYLLKTSRKLAVNAANRRNLWKESPTTGLWQVPRAVTRWALEKTHEKLPVVPFYAAGCADGLIKWVMDNVTGIYLVEFSVCHWSEVYGHGFAGTADGLLDVGGAGPYIIDWKTTTSGINSDTLTQYEAQGGGYASGFRSMVGVKPAGVIIVAALPTGHTKHHLIHDVDDAQRKFLDRFEEFCRTRT